MTMTPGSVTFKHVVAFEVSKEALVVHVLPSERQYAIANTPKAIAKLLDQEKRHNAEADLGPMLVVCEATGGYERHILDACTPRQMACHKAHGKRVRDFAKYLGILAKTDPIDARVLALFGIKTEGLRLYQQPSAEQQALCELKARRDDVQKMLIAEGNRLEHARHASVLKSLRAHIAALRKAFEVLEKEIMGHVRRSETLARKAKLMRSLKGVGPVTAVTLLANLPELGTFSKGQVAALCGLAPLNKDSGKASAPRHIAAGRAAIRRTIYMAAVVAIKCNPIMASFADALTKRGKPFKVTVVAVMRRLLVTLNAILKSNKPWKHAKNA